jgi:hypothetical protein
MPIKPALCAVAIALTAFALPAIAQPTQNPTPPAAAPAPQDQATPDARDRMGSRDDEARRWHRDGRRWRDNEEGDRRFGDRRGRGMEGRGMMGRFGMARMCGPNGARIGDAMMDRIERVTRPSTEQRAAFDKLKEAAGKAGEIVRAACPAERSLTPPGRLANAEKRLTAMLEAIRTVRPAMDAYYATLSDEQKARLTLAQPGMRHRGMGPHGRFWRDRGEGRGNNGGSERTQFGPDDQIGAEKL